MRADRRLKALSLPLPVIAALVAATHRAASRTARVRAWSPLGWLPARVARYRSATQLLMSGSAWARTFWFRRMEPTAASTGRRASAEIRGQDTYPLALASPSSGGFRDRYPVPLSPDGATDSLLATFSNHILSSSFNASVDSVGAALTT